MSTGPEAKPTYEQSIILELWKLCEEKHGEHASTEWMFQRVCDAWNEHSGPHSMIDHSDVAAALYFIRDGEPDV